MALLAPGPQLRSHLRDHRLLGRDEAAAYLAHPVLGPRLLALTGIVNALPGGDAEAVFGGIDALKFRSCMTLFAAVAPGQPLFRQALDKYF